MTARLSAVLALACVAGGCVTSPVYRPAGPLMGEHHVEAGVGPHAAFGQEAMGVGASAWAVGQFHPNVEVIAHGSSTDYFLYDGSGAPFDDVLYGGGIGLRGRHAFFESLIVGAEGWVGYGRRTGGANPFNQEELFIAMFGLPVAEQAFPGFWVYTDIQLGIAVPFQKDPRGPFFGVQEIPIGVAWEIRPWLLLVAEGGYALNLPGGYGGVALAFRL